jgi:hypothetical protein
MQRERRRFFGWLGGASLAGVAGVPALAATARAMSSPSSPSLPQPISTTWDVSWTDRVTGAHRAVFDSPQMADGSALFRAVAWCDHYKEVYGVERKDMSPVVVFRHEGIGLIMNDEYWRRFNIGKESKIKNEKGKWTEVNPISAQSTPDEVKARRYKLETFVAGGGIVLACGWAFGLVVSRFREEDKLEHKEADARAREHLLPGVIIQPNGIFAVVRAQEAGCHYVMAS